VWPASASRYVCGLRVSVPERTVDVWVAGVVADKFEDAQIWAPTTRGSDNWDLGVSIPVPGAHGSPGKLLVLENKGATPLKSGDHRIRIDLPQIHRYCRSPYVDYVFYVLPSPPWSGEPPHWVVPPQAGHRSTAGGWLWVVPAPMLLGWLRTTNRSSILASQIPALGSVVLDDFLDEIHRCEWAQTWLTGQMERETPAEVEGGVRIANPTLSPVAAFIPRANLAERVEAE